MPPTEIRPGVYFGRFHADDDTTDFDCGHKDTNEFLKDDAIEYQNLSLATTYVLKDAESKIIGFVSLAMGAIKTSQVKEGVIPGVKISQYPGMKIGQLGITKERQGQDLGEFLLMTSIKLADEFRVHVPPSLLVRASVTAYISEVSL